MRNLWRMLARSVTAMTAVLVALVGAASAAAADQPASDRSTARFEVRFIKDMIDHHAMAVQMARMCQGRAVHPQLRTMCRSIATSQQREIQQMRSWLRDWYDTDHTPMTMPGMMRQMTRMQRWSGTAFEIHFMEMMIPHHQQAIREAQTCLNRAEHRELRQLCRTIIETQRAEIRQMQGWLCEWYDRCRGRHEPRRGQAA